jgi:hypothetical protein
MGKLHLDREGKAACSSTGERLTTAPLNVTCKGCKSITLREAVIEAAALRAVVDQPNQETALALAEVQRALECQQAANAKMSEALWRIAVGVRHPNHYARKVLDAVS